MKGNDDTPVGRVLIGRLDVERATEALAEPAPQVMDGPVGQRDVGHAAGVLADLLGRPEAGIDVDGHVVVGLPGDAD